MILLPDEQKQLFNFVIDDLLKERGSAIYLTDALAYAERAVVSALLNGKSEITLDLGHVVQTAEAQRETKALFKEYAGDFSVVLGWKRLIRTSTPTLKIKSFSPLALVCADSLMRFRGLFFWRLP